MNNKIVFLDADGCINSNKWYRSTEYYSNLFKDPDIDPHVIDLINQFTNETDVKIVISSSWKIDDYCLERLDRAGLENIIDITPNLIFSVPIEDYSRGMEIEYYLQEHPEIEKYLILDDQNDFFDYQQKNFLLIDYQVGLTEENIEYCKQWFK
jgi:hypothetical protein